MVGDQEAGWQGTGGVRSCRHQCKDEASGVLSMLGRLESDMMYVSDRSLWLLFRDGPQGRGQWGKPGEQSGGHCRD